MTVRQRTMFFILAATLTATGCVRANDLYCADSNGCLSGEACVAHLCVPSDQTTVVSEGIDPQEAPDGGAPPDAGTADADITPHDPEPDCTNGETRSCYTGPPETLNVAPCTAGLQTCVDGAWGSCEGEVIPEDDGMCGWDFYSS